MISSAEAVQPVEIDFRLFRSISELIADAKPPDFVIGGLIESDSLGVFFGPWGCGKSLLMFDLALSVALGLDVHGRSVKQGPVVYIAGEGAGGLARRFAAWTALRKASLENAPVAVSNGSIALLDDELVGDLEIEIQKLAALWGALPSLIVVDTVSRCFGGGNENSAEHMAQFIDAVDKRLRQPFNSAVALVHHTGHEAKERGRGSSVLPAAADVEYRVERPEDQIVRLTCTKSRDFTPPPPLCWQITPVPLVLQGQDVDSVTVEAVPDYEPPAVGNAPKQQEMLKLLTEEYSRRRENIEAGGRDPDSARISAREWQKMGIDGKIVRDRKRFHETKKALINKQLVREENGYVWPM